MKNHNFANHLEAIEEPKLLGENRFTCINQLEDLINAKKGAYTWDERREWLSILYTCLEGPNLYFLTGKIEALPKESKKLTKYRGKLGEFQQTIKQEKRPRSSVYTYLLCVRDLLNKTEPLSRKENASNALAKDLQEGIWRALEERMAQNPELENRKDGYQRVLKDTFINRQNRLNHPAFFLLLPYYLFVKLGQCEGLISRKNTDPFSIPQMNNPTKNWTIRNSPISADKEEIYDRLEELYDLIEESLCVTLHKNGYRTIGQALLYAFCRYADKYKAPEYPKCRKKDIEELSLEYSADFSAPFWEYDVWASCFCKPFNVEINTMLDDMVKLFNLSFRPASEPAKRTIEKILQEYSQHNMDMESRSFCLSELLRALCDIYNFRNFDTAAPFANSSLRESVNLLLDFLIALDHCSPKAVESPIQEKWLYLLEYGYPVKSANKELWWGNIPDYLINPSRVLYRALWMRSSAQNKEIPDRYSLSSFFPYSKSLRLLSDSLYHALCSEEEVLHDMAFWGGVEIELDREYIHNLGDAFHVWSVWHRNEAVPFDEFEQYAKNEAQNIGAALSKLPPFRSEPVILNVSEIGIDTEESDVLDEQKGLLFAAIPELKKLFGSAKNLDNFRYACILYFLFHTLRDNLCYRAFKLYTKLLQLQ